MDLDFRLVKVVPNAMTLAIQPKATLPSLCQRVWTHVTAIFQDRSTETWTSNIQRGNTGFDCWVHALIPFEPASNVLSEVTHLPA